MANLMRFIAPGSRANQRLDLYLNRWPHIGDATFLVVEPLRLEVEGKVKFLGQEYRGRIGIVMPDEAPAGTCTLVIDGASHRCPYRVVGNTLEINAPGRKITLQDNDRSWTWVEVTGLLGSIGLWPSGVAAADEAFFGAPGAAGALV